MANQLTKPFQNHQPGTIVKIHELSNPMAVISIPSSTTPTKKYLVPVDILGRSQPKPISELPTKDWTSLDSIPMSYTVAPLNRPIRFSCYCGTSKLYFSLEDVKNQKLEKLALDKAIASCTKCSDRRSHGSIHTSNNTGDNS